MSVKCNFDLWTTLFPSWPFCNHLQLCIFKLYIYAFNNNFQVDVIYMHFTKPYDRVDDRILGKILENSGFGKPLLSWFISYPSNWKTFVNVFDIQSNINDELSGIFKGGNFSPIIFALFIKNIKSIFRNCTFLLFSDDLNIFLKLSTPNKIGLELKILFYVILHNT